MAKTNLSLSQRIRGLQRIMRDVRLGASMTPENIRQAEATAAECAAEAERLEIAAGTASVASQLKAAGGNAVMMRQVLRNAGGKENRHG